MKEAIFFCIVGLPLFGKEGSGTPVFKIQVRALVNEDEKQDRTYNAVMVEQSFSLMNNLLTKKIVKMYL